MRDYFTEKAISETKLNQKQTTFWIANKEVYWSEQKLKFFTTNKDFVLNEVQS